jgi:predicted nucleic acid-binding protein
MATVITIQELVRGLVSEIIDKCMDDVTKAKLIGIVENWLVNGSLADAAKAVEDIESIAKASCLDPTDIIRLARMILARRIDDKVTMMTAPSP